MSREFPEQLRRKRVPAFGAIQPDPGSPIADLVLASFAFAHPQPSASITIGIAANNGGLNERPHHVSRDEACQAHWGEARASGLIDPAPAVRMMLVSAPDPLDGAGRLHPAFDQTIDPRNSR
jgi:hypothetical protein